MKRKVLVLQGSSYAAVVTMFIDRGWEIVKNVEDADLLQFTGGSDLDPTLYNQFRHPWTAYDRVRDEAEEQLYRHAKELGIPCAGICRGGQFLHVMNGGDMWQDVNNHGSGLHQASAYGKLLPILVSSDHHQEMRLNHNTEDRAMILMFANEATRKETMSSLDGGSKYKISRTIDGKVVSDNDIEALYYSDTNDLCFQPHPEYSSGPSSSLAECQEIYFHFLENYVFAKEEEEDDYIPFKVVETQQDAACDCSDNEQLRCM